jgi:hypothetical protein
MGVYTTIKVGDIQPSILRESRLREGLQIDPPGKPTTCTQTDDGTDYTHYLGNYVSGLCDDYPHNSDCPCRQADSNSAICEKSFFYAADEFTNNDGNTELDVDPQYCYVTHDGKCSNMDFCTVTMDPPDYSEIQIASHVCITYPLSGSTYQEMYEKSRKIYVGEKDATPPNVDPCQFFSSSNLCEEIYFKKIEYGEFQGYLYCEARRVDECWTVENGCTNTTDFTPDPTITILPCNQTHKSDSQNPCYVKDISMNKTVCENTVVVHGDDMKQCVWTGTTPSSCEPFGPCKSNS